MAILVWRNCNCVSIWLFWQAWHCLMYAMTSSRLCRAPAAARTLSSSAGRPQLSGTRGRACKSAMSLRSLAGARASGPTPSSLPQLLERARAAAKARVSARASPRLRRCRSGACQACRRPRAGRSRALTETRRLQLVARLKPCLEARVQHIAATPSALRARRACRTLLPHRLCGTPHLANRKGIITKQVRYRHTCELCEGSRSSSDRLVGQSQALLQRIQNAMCGEPLSTKLATSSTILLIRQAAIERVWRGCTGRATVAAKSTDSLYRAQD